LSSHQCACAAMMLAHRSVVVMEERAQAIQSSPAKSVTVLARSTPAWPASFVPARQRYHSRCACLLGPKQAHLRESECFDAFDAGRWWDRGFEMMHLVASSQAIVVLSTGGKMGGPATEQRSEQPSRALADRGLSACCGVGVGGVERKSGPCQDVCGAYRRMLEVPARSQSMQCGVALLNTDTTAGRRM
jgi:hypothetical protein